MIESLWNLTGASLAILLDNFKVIWQTQAQISGFRDFARSWDKTVYKYDIQYLTYVLTMLKNSENNGLEETGLVTPTPTLGMVRVNIMYEQLWYHIMCK